MKNSIIKTINSYISEFAVDGKIPLNKVEEFCNKINAELDNGQYLPNSLCVGATLQKWEEAGDNSLEEVSATSWEDAECMVIHMSIVRPRPRKDKKLHEEIINECLSIIDKVIPMDIFIGVDIDDAFQMDRVGEHDTVGIYTYNKQNYYDNHKEFHGIQ